MKRFQKIVVTFALAALFIFISTSCIRQDYLMFEDGEFDGIEFSDYDLMHNAEIELDDVDRN